MDSRKSLDRGYFALKPTSSIRLRFPHTAQNELTWFNSKITVGIRQD